MYFIVITPLNLVGYLPRSNFFFIIEARIGAEASVFGDALWFTRCRFGLVLRGRWPAGRALPVGEMFVPAPEVSVADNDACGLSLNEGATSTQYSVLSNEAPDIRQGVFCTLYTVNFQLKRRRIKRAA